MKKIALVMALGFLGCALLSGCGSMPVYDKTSQVIDTAQQYNAQAPVLLGQIKTVIDSLAAITPQLQQQQAKIDTALDKVKEVSVKVDTGLQIAQQGVQTAKNGDVAAGLQAAGKAATDSGLPYGSVVGGTLALAGTLYGLFKGQQKAAAQQQAIELASRLGPAAPAQAAQGG